MAQEPQTQGEAERERQAAAEKDQAEVTKPGQKLKETDPEAYNNTYDENGNLRIKSEKPLAGVGSQKPTTLEDSADKGTSIESEVVPQGEGHPQSEGSDKVEVKHPKTAEEQDDANKPVKHDTDPDEPTTGRVAGADDTGSADSKKGEDNKVTDAPHNKPAEDTKVDESNGAKSGTKDGESVGERAQDGKPAAEAGKADAKSAKNQKQSK